MYLSKEYLNFIKYNLIEFIKTNYLKINLFNYKIFYNKNIFIKTNIKTFYYVFLYESLFKNITKKQIYVKSLIKNINEVNFILLNSYKKYLINNYVFSFVREYNKYDRLFFSKNNNNSVKSFIKYIDDNVLVNFKNNIIKLKEIYGYNNSFCCYVNTYLQSFVIKSLYNLSIRINYISFNKIDSYISEFGNLHLFKGIYFKNVYGLFFQYYNNRYVFDYFNSFYIVYFYKKSYLIRYFRTLFNINSFNKFYNSIINNKKIVYNGCCYVSNYSYSKNLYMKINISNYINDKGFFNFYNISRNLNILLNRYDYSYLNNNFITFFVKKIHYKKNKHSLLFKIIDLSYLYNVFYNLNFVFTLNSLSILRKILLFDFLNTNVINGYVSQYFNNKIEKLNIIKSVIHLRTKTLTKNYPVEYDLYRFLHRNVNLIIKVNKYLRINQTAVKSITFVKASTIFRFIRFYNLRKYTKYSIYLNTVFQINNHKKVYKDNLIYNYFSVVSKSYF